MNSNPAEDRPDPPACPPPGGTGISLWNRAWDWLIQPQGRLSPNFPLTGKKLGKAYVVASIIFFVGSFLPGLLFIAGILALAYCAPEPVAYKWLTAIVDVQDGSLKATPMTVLLLVSFISGFVPELWYLSRVLRREGKSLWKVMGLSLDSLRGATWLHTAWTLLWQTAVAYGVIFALDFGLSHLVQGPEQPTVQLMRQAAGGNIVIWFVMAAILAPLFEELVFRGFLFQALRSTFYEWQRADQPQADKVASASKPRGLLMRAVLLFFAPVLWCLRMLERAGGATARWLGKHVVNTPRRADLLAVMLSGLVFAVEHLQFQPVTLLMLFVMGCALAEIFRRTGSLWPAILLHAVNNGAVVVAIALSH